MAYDALPADSRQLCRSSADDESALFRPVCPLSVYLLSGSRNGAILSGGILQFHFSVVAIFLMIRAGLPATTVMGGTSLVTTLPAPTMAP